MLAFVEVSVFQARIFVGLHRLFSGMPSIAFLPNKTELPASLVEQHSGESVVKKGTNSSHFEVNSHSLDWLWILVLVCHSLNAFENTDGNESCENRYFSQCCFRLEWQTLKS